MTRPVAIIALVLLASTNTAHASPEGAGPDSDFWATAADPGKKQADKLMRIAVATIFAEGDDAAKLAKAEDMLARAVSLSPASLEAKFWLAIARHRQGDARGCATALGHVMARDPLFRPPNHERMERAPLGYRYALCLAEAGDFASADRELSRLFAGGPVRDWRTLFLRGQVAMARGKLSAAVRSLRGAIRLNPYHPGLNLALATAYDRGGRLSEARRSASYAILRDPQLRRLARTNAVPEADRYYYAALGHIASNQLPWAIIYFRHYLAAAKTTMWDRRVRQQLASLWAARPAPIIVLENQPRRRAQRLLTMIENARGQFAACVAKTPGMLLRIRVQPPVADNHDTKPGSAVMVYLEYQFATPHKAAQEAILCTDEVARNLSWPRWRPSAKGSFVQFYVLSKPPQRPD